jgi:CRP-like cAMP-binding protein
LDFAVIRDAVKTCETFDGFDDTRLGFLLMTCQTMAFRAGKVIYAKGEEARKTFCLIVSGTVSIVSEADKVLESIGPGDIIGEIGTISPQSKRTITVQAGGPVEALEWDYETVDKGLPDLLPRLKDLAWKRATNW